MDESELLEHLLGLEQRGWESLCDGTGDAFYGDIMIDDGLMVLANGEVMDRATTVAALGQAPAWRSFDLTDVRLIQFGADGAALVYVGSARRESDQSGFSALMSSVYVQQHGDWRLALYQQTPVVRAPAT